MERDDLSLRHLRGVVALADELNLNRAAERIGVAAPALTRAVAEVEEAIGARLFERTARSFTLTPVGVRLVTDVRTALAHTDLALRQAGDAGRVHPHPLRIAYAPLAGMTVLPRLLAACRTLPGNYLIETEESPTAAQRPC